MNESSEDKWKKAAREWMQYHGGWRGYAKQGAISIAVVMLPALAVLESALHLRLESLYAYASNAGASLGLLILGMLAGKRPTYWTFAVQSVVVMGMGPWVERLFGHLRPDENIWLLTVPPIAAPFIGLALYRLLRLLVRSRSQD